MTNVHNFDAPRPNTGAKPKLAKATITLTRLQMLNAVRFYNRARMDGTISEFNGLTVMQIVEAFGEKYDIDREGCIRLENEA